MKAVVSTTKQWNLCSGILTNVNTKKNVIESMYFHVLLFLCVNKEKICHG